MYNIPGLAGEPSIEDIGMQTRGAHHVRAYRMDYASSSDDRATWTPARRRAWPDGGVWRARSDADDSYDELAVAGTGKDVVLMATGVKFSDRAKPPH
jgi:hypothetical protein